MRSLRSRTTGHSYCYAGKRLVDNMGARGDDEHTVLICKPLSVPGYVVPGSLVCKCSRCRERITVAPSSWRLMYENPGTEVVCSTCGAAIMRDHPGPVDPPTPAQLREVEDSRRRRGGHYDD